MKLVIRDIARQFLPHRPHYYYTRIKMATDPLYVGVGNALAGTTEPLLDLGCGIGLLAHALRAQGFAGDYRGVDIDAGKIDSARAASIRAGHASVRFDTVDLKSGFPHHRGSVALLDILTPGAILVIRTGLARAGWRLRFTRGVDRIARLTRWMNVGPQRYPRREELEQRFAGHGLQATFRPLHGRMPFENWLVCVRREAIATGPAAAVSALTSD
jgi:SAM-dependent methyltransferase